MMKNRIYIVNLVLYIINVICKYFNTVVLFLWAVGLESRVDQPCRVEIQHGMAVPGELKTKIFT